ncbi:CapA family protein, partial [candidate division KSB1 bacterium]|nr:CapA family protein [candidate division KSB1 bacterium]
MTKSIEKRAIRIAAVGDISPGDDYFRYGRGVRAQMEKFGAHYPLSQIAQTLHSFDLVIGNLEGVVSDLGYDRKRLASHVMRGLPEFAVALFNSGIDVVTLANNHIMQHGAAAAWDSEKQLQRAGLITWGLQNPNRFPAGQILERGGWRIALLALNDRPRQHFIDSPIYCAFDTISADRDIEQCRKTADIVIISLHWGDEFSFEPSAKQRATARHLIDSGADIVIGHHPHVLQGMESYCGKPIFYSLGNFVFDLDWYSPAMESIIAVFHLLPRQGLIKTDFIPVRINTHFQPYILRDREQKAWKRNWQHRQKSLNQPQDLSSYNHTVRHLTKSERRLSHVWWLKRATGFPPHILRDYIRDFIERRFQPLLPTPAPETAIPVLMYHEVLPRKLAERCRYSPYVIPEEIFAQHLHYLKSRGYTTVTLPRLAEIGPNNSEKIVALTFDDGFIGNLLYALPLLRRYGFTATLFAAVDKIGQPNYVDWQQLAELNRQGISIQSHTLSHRDLELLSQVELKSELVDSRATIANHLGKPVDVVSYPQGSFNTRIFEQAALAGYRAGCTTLFGFFVPGQDLLQIPRIAIHNNSSVKELHSILTQKRLFLLRRRWVQKAKRGLRSLIGVETYGKLWLAFHPAVESQENKAGTIHR